MMEIHASVEQGTPEWFALRVGRVTASNLSSVLAKGEGKTRKAYLYKLASEIVTGEPTESFKSPAMERGNVMEAEARDTYAFMRDVELVRVGFITNGRNGASPDSLIGDDGMLEIKTQRADLLVETLFKDQFPTEHKAQCQGNLWIAEREWIDISVYWKNMPMFIKRAYRDDVYISTLEREVAIFNEDLDATVEKIRRYGVAA